MALTRSQSDARFVLQGLKPSFAEPSDRASAFASDSVICSPNSGTLSWPGAATTSTRALFSLTLAPLHAPFALSSRIYIRIMGHSPFTLVGVANDPNPSWTPLTSGISVGIPTSPPPATFSAFNSILGVVYNATQMGDDNIVGRTGYIGAVVAAPGGATTSSWNPTIAGAGGPTRPPVLSGQSRYSSGGKALISELSLETTGYRQLTLYFESDGPYASSVLVGAPDLNTFGIYVNIDADIYSAGYPLSSTHSCTCMDQTSSVVTSIPTVTNNTAPDNGYYAPSVTVNTTAAAAGSAISLLALASNSLAATVGDLSPWYLDCSNLGTIPIAATASLVATGDFPFALQSVASSSLGLSATLSLPTGQFILFGDAVPASLATTGTSTIAIDAFNSVPSDSSLTTNVVGSLGAQSGSYITIDNFGTTGSTLVPLDGAFFTLPATSTVLPSSLIGPLSGVGTATTASGTTPGSRPICILVSADGLTHSPVTAYRCGQRGAISAWSSQSTNVVPWTPAISTL